jgi:hypothetical protein
VFRGVGRGGLASCGAVSEEVKTCAAFGIGCRYDTSPQNGSCRATLGSYMATVEKAGVARLRELESAAR